MSDPEADSTVDSGGVRRRRVDVPMPIYKVVTVFSTLIAAVTIVFGFFLLDAATLQISLFRSAIEVVFSWFGLAIGADLLSGALGVVGLVAIAFGAWIFVLGTRFTAEGMGNAQEDSDEEDDNG